jgi:hypothetical protein
MVLGTVFVRMKQQRLSKSIQPVMLQMIRSYLGWARIGFVSELSEFVRLQTPHWHMGPTGRELTFLAIGGLAELARGKQVLPVVCQPEISCMIYQPVPAVARLGHSFREQGEIRG